MTPSEIEPATFRFVAQCLNQLCHRVTHIAQWFSHSCKVLCFLNSYCLIFLSISENCKMSNECLISFITVGNDDRQLCVYIHV